MKNIVFLFDSALICCNFVCAKQNHYSYGEEAVEIVPFGYAGFSGNYSEGTSLC